MVSKEQVANHMWDLLNYLSAEYRQLITIVHSDRALNFISTLLQKNNDRGFALFLNAPDYPSRNGFSERTIQKINRYFRTALLEYKL